MFSKKNVRSPTFALKHKNNLMNGLKTVKILKKRPIIQTLKKSYFFVHSCEDNFSSIYTKCKD